MPFLEMLDVAIGMIFIYLLLSLICSAINEWIESNLKSRAVDLERGIRELLQDPNGTALVQKIYRHPLVSSLYKGKYNPIKIKNNHYAQRSNLPSYIPARNFALAILDIAMPSTPAAMGGAAGATLPSTPPTAIAAGGRLDPPAFTSPALASLRTSIGTIAIPEVRAALLTLIDAAGGDINKARENIEAWYNSSMDRVSGWYKRRVQRIILVLGFIITAFVNADTFAIFKSLVDNPPLRNAMVAAAAAAAAQTQNITGDQKDPKVRIKEYSKELQGLGLPMGWSWRSHVNADSDAVPNLRAIPPFNTEEVGFSIWIWFIKVLGWLVTAMAISLGAPFWFDTLNKVMVIRSTVKPTEKSPDEASEDRQKRR